ncbi:uncharacterized protein LOC127263050 [Andrographis paniculata]|uniref:uncharacterized protein LOC127263050 n=1 Tax=Andrographis paniculata TaxID=175694 RepID=UPI0021E90D8A|nr:uncharacterized protein LOC127263050 [Andrographis paniculata]
MSSMLTSQGLVFATAMAVSAGTIILFDLLRDKYFPHHHHHHPPPPPPPNRNRNPPPLKSCLSSGNKKSKKRVQFAEDVKESKGNGEIYRRRRRESDHGAAAANCGNETLELKKMPANRAALYSGILRDRLHRMEYSY